MPSLTRTDRTGKHRHIDNEHIRPQPKLTQMAKMRYTTSDRGMRGEMSKDNVTMPINNRKMTNAGTRLPADRSSGSG